MDTTLSSILDIDLQRTIENIREVAKRIWQRPLHRYYTDHTIAHSERIIGLLNGLTAGMMITDKRLSPIETFILLAAAYLHDIGMQNEKFAGGNLDEIRDKHNEQTAEMIYAVFEDPANAFAIPLTHDPAIIEAVATVAKGHRRVDLGNEEYESFDHSGKTIRLKLLAALLRFSDELDVDHRRVDMEVMKLQTLPLESQLHWWKCHYVNSVSIVDEYIKITYRFPQNRPDYEEFITRLVEEEVRAKLVSLEEIFRANAVKVALGKSQVRLLRLVEALPPDVEEHARSKAKIPKEITERTVGSYAFENREEDFRRIFLQLESEPYLHLYGPSGIGKTYLVRQLLQKNYAQRPHAYVDFNDPRFRSQSHSVEDLLQEIQRQFCLNVQFQSSSLTELIAELSSRAKETPYYGVVVLDNVDHIAPGIRRQLREKILLALQEAIADPTQYVRFIAVSQVEMAELMGIGRISFQPHLLEEFRGVLCDMKTYKNLLRQAVARWGDKPLDPQDPRDDNLLQDWANTLYNLTGGHPGAIEGTLNYVGRQTQFANVEAFMDLRQSICQNVLVPLVEQQVQSCFPAQSGYQLAFQQLWVFRYLSKGVFRRLLHEVKEKPYWGDLNAAARESDYGAEYAPLWERFTETTLLQCKGVRHLLSHQLTPIWRKMGNLVLRVAEPALYRQLHRDARLVFEQLFEGKYEKQDASMRIDCLVEILHHLTQEADLSSSDGSRSCFTQSVTKRLDDFIFSLYDSPFFDEHLYFLGVLLESDQELRAELDQVGLVDTSQQLTSMIKEHRQSGRRNRNE